MMQDPWSINTHASIRSNKSAPCSPIKPQIVRTHSDAFHITHKVPVGDTPYVKAKRVQLVDKDPEKAIALFWAAINAGDRVDSALKDMAIVMKQQNRAEEAIEAIRSLRNRCSDQAQESLDNILLDLYKRCGRLDDQIALLKHKLQLIQQGLAFNGKRTKTARSQGRKFQVTLEQEATRLLGNLGWALMQKENYIEAEAAYRRALIIGPDNNKMCNLGICLMKQGRITEAKEILKQVRPAAIGNLRGADSHLKAFERAQEMLRDLESKLLIHNSGNPNPSRDRLDQSWFFDAFVGPSSASIWQPQPCIDYPLLPRDNFADENVNNTNLNNTKPKVTNNNNNIISNLNIYKPELNVDAQPFYSTRVVKSLDFQDPLANLKRNRSGNLMDNKKVLEESKVGNKEGENSGNSRRKSVSAEERWPELPDINAFNEAIVAAVLVPVLEKNSKDIGNGNKLKENENNKEIGNKVQSNENSPALAEGKMGKRLRIFQDITKSLNSF